MPLHSKSSPYTIICTAYMDSWKLKPLPGQDHLKYTHTRQIKRQTAKHFLIMSTISVPCFLKSSACPLNLLLLCPPVQRSEANRGKETFCDLSLHLPQSGDVLWSLAGRQQEPMERPLHLYSGLDHTDTRMTRFQLNKLSQTKFHEYILST